MPIFLEGTPTLLKPTPIMVHSNLWDIIVHTAIIKRGHEFESGSAEPELSVCLAMSAMSDACWLLACWLGFDQLSILAGFP